jgi:hypothetical protein
MNEYTAERLPPPPFWRTRYFAGSAAARPDRRAIDTTMMLILTKTGNL